MYLSPKSLPSVTSSPGVCFMLSLAAEGGWCCCCSSVQLRDCVICGNVSCYMSVLLLQWLFYGARGLCALWYLVSGWMAVSYWCCLLVLCVKGCVLSASALSSCWIAGTLAVWTTVKPNCDCWTELVERSQIFKKPAYLTLIHVKESYLKRDKYR